VVKHWALILLLLYIILLTGLSLLNLEKLPSLGSSFDDKIFHFGSHAVLSGLCFNYFIRTTTSKPILLSALIPVFYGLIIEWLQGIGNTSRTSDIYDVLANILGMIFVIIILSIMRNVKLK